jgi:ankyrin repeat protein
MGEFARLISNGDVGELETTISRKAWDISTLVNELTSREWYPIHLAAILKDGGPMINFLVSKGANVNAKNSNGFTALHISVGKMLVSNVVCLILNKADVNLQNNLLDTPIHIACQKKCLNLVQILINAKANTFTRNKNGKVPLELLPENLRCAFTVIMFDE